MPRPAILSALAFALAFACAAQTTITAQPSAVPGVTVTVPQPKGFAESVAAIVGAKQPPGFAEWLPYSVILKNGTKEPIAAFVLIYAGADGPGASPRRLTAGSTEGFTAPDRDIQPGQSAVVSPRGVFRNARDLRGFDGAGDGMETLKRMTKIDVTVDAVVFASGQFTGPDATGSYDRFQAEIDGPRAVATALIEKRTMTPMPAIAAWLEGLAAHDPADLSEQHQEAATAGRLVDIYHRRGEKALYAAAGAILNAPPFLLHR